MSDVMNHPFSRPLALAAVAPGVVAILVGCSSTTTTRKNEHCTVGATEPCLCPDGSASRRVCGVDGTFGACSCGGDGGAGGERGSTEAGGSAGDDEPDLGGSRSGGAAGQESSPGGVSAAGAPQAGDRSVGGAIGSAGTSPGGAPPSGGTAAGGGPGLGGSGEGGAAASGGDFAGGTSSIGGSPAGGVSGSPAGGVSGSPSGGEGASTEGGAAGASACSWGTQDNDDDGVCLPNCASAALSCPAHATCTDASGAAECACVTGYVGSPQSCVWAITPNDPSFQDDPEGAWTPSGGVDLQPEASALIADGLAIFDATTICDENGSLVQSVTIPRFEHAEPMQIELTARGVCATDRSACEVDPVNVTFNGGTMSFQVPNELGTLTRCLGERAFGATAPLLVRHGHREQACAPNILTYLLEIDHLQIKPNPNCIAPRTIRNADFEDDTGWVVTSQTGNSGFVDGAGREGSRAWRLETTAGTPESPAVAGMASWPVADGAALEVSLAGTLGKSLQFGGVTGVDSAALRVPWAEYRGSGGALTGQTLCIPEYAKGMVGLVEWRTTNGSAETDIWDARSFDIDAMVPHVSSACPANAFLLDPGFERSTDSIRYWLTTATKTDVIDTATADIIADATTAHEGGHALVMTSAQVCGSARAEAVLTVPPPTAHEGPALRFFYTRIGSEGSVFVRVGAASTLLGEQGNYTEQVICLDPAAVGQGLLLQLHLQGGTGSCGTPLSSALRATFDDLEVTTDPACPIQ